MVARYVLRLFSSTNTASSPKTDDAKKDKEPVLWQFNLSALKAIWTM